MGSIEAKSLFGERHLGFCGKQVQNQHSGDMVGSTRAAHSEQRPQLKVLGGPDAAAQSDRDRVAPSTMLGTIKDLYPCS